MSVTVNHVLSKNIYSKIFEAIFTYFKKYSNIDQVRHMFTTRPVEYADIYHYHRPNLEKDFKKNAFATVHHDLYDTDGWLNMETFISAYKQMSCIVCLNKMQQNILKEFKIDNTIVIPWGYNEDIFYLNNSSNQVLQKKKCLGIVSKRYGRKVKGEALLYELCKRLPSESFKFILVGEGRGEDADYLEDLGFEVEVFEYLPYVLFDSLYDKIDALLITSYFEGGPANLPEAYAKGVPIISTPVGFARDYIRDGYNGILLTKKPNIDADKIIKILNNDFYKNLKDNAMQMRESIPTWQQVVELYNQQYIKFTQ